MAKQENDQALLNLDADARVALLRRENKQLRDKLRKVSAGWDIVSSAFEEAYSRPLQVDIQNPPAKGKKPHREEAVVHLTDIHFGKETLTYNSTIAAERLMAACTAVAEITELRRNYATIDRLIVLMGGDFVEGEGKIFPTQAHEIDQDLVDQMVKFGPERVASAIMSLAQSFQELHILGVPGNHGKQGKHAPERNNADSIMYEVVRLIVSKCPKVRSKIRWSLPYDRPRGEEWYANFVICRKWNGLLVHGETVQGSRGYPWYGHGNKVAGWAASLPAFDYMFSGHFHVDAAFDVYGRRVLSTGSMESDNTYANKNFAASSSPKQRLCFFNARHGLLSDNPINLAVRKPRP